VTRSLSADAAKTLAQAFIFIRLDYCNALLYGVSERLIHRLQSVQNAAARLVTGARRRDHITPILRQLHWLPVRQRVTFKIAVLVFQCLTGQAPRTWQTTVSSARADSDQPTQRRASSDDQITVSATGVLRLLDHVCGTCCQSIYGCMTVLNSLNGCSRPICLVLETAALCDALVRSAVYK